MCMFGAQRSGNAQQDGRGAVMGLRAFNAAFYGGKNAQLTQVTNRARASLGLQPREGQAGHVTIGSAPGAVKTGG
jgi:hypothetical protein